MAYIGVKYLHSAALVIVMFSVCCVLMWLLLTNSNISSMFSFVIIVPSIWSGIKHVDIVYISVYSVWLLYLAFILW